MSTIAEHLAALEFMREMKYSRDASVRQHSNFSMEASMFAEVHLGELIAAQSPEDMAAARLDVRQRYRAQFPDVAEKLIAGVDAALSQGGGA